MTSSPQPGRPPATQQRDPQQAPQEPLPTTSDPALISISEKGRAPRPTRVERDR